MSVPAFAMRYLKMFTHGVYLYVVEILNRLRLRQEMKKKPAKASEHWNNLAPFRISCLVETLPGRIQEEMYRALEGGV